MDLLTAVCLTLFISLVTLVYPTRVICRYVVGFTGMTLQFKITNLTTKKTSNPANIVVFNQGVKLNQRVAVSTVLSKRQVHRCHPKL